MRSEKERGEEASWRSSGRGKKTTEEGDRRRGEASTLRSNGDQRWKGHWSRKAATPFPRLPFPLSRNQSSSLDPLRNARVERRGCDLRFVRSLLLPRTECVLEQPPGLPRGSLVHIGVPVGVGGSEKARGRRETEGTHQAVSVSNVSSSSSPDSRARVPTCPKRSSANCSRSCKRKKSCRQRVEGKRRGGRSSRTQGCECARKVGIFSAARDPIRGRARKAMRL